MMNAARAAAYAKQSAPVLVLVSGLALALWGGHVLVHFAHHCDDFGYNGHVLARNSIGPTLPLPIVQVCDVNAETCLPFILGYVMAMAGTLLLACRPVRKSIVAVTAFAAVLLSAAMPFVPNSDPYAYALYAFQELAHSQISYVHTHLSAAPGVLDTLLRLFPGNGNQLRSAVNYGSVFVALQALAVGPFGLLSLKAMILAERALGALCLIGMAVVLALSQHDDRKRYQVFVAVALNPILLFQSVAFAHGDIIALVLLAIAFLMYQRGRFALAMACCVLAGEVRITALLACVALLAELVHRKAFLPCGKALLSGIFVLLGSALVSRALFGEFHVVPSGSLLSSRWDSPGLILSTTLFGYSSVSVVAGLLAGCAIAVFAAYIAVRERRYSLLAIAGICAVPIVRAWYVQCLAPLAVIVSDAAYRTALCAFMCIAALNEAIGLIRKPNGIPYCVTMVFIQWLIPLALYGLLRRRQARPIAIWSASR